MNTELKNAMGQIPSDLSGYTSQSVAALTSAQNLPEGTDNEQYIKADAIMQAIDGLEKSPSEPIVEKKKKSKLWWLLLLLIIPALWLLWPTGLQETEKLPAPADTTLTVPPTTPPTTGTTPPVVTPPPATGTAPDTTSVVTTPPATPPATGSTPPVVTTPPATPPATGSTPPVVTTPPATPPTTGMAPSTHEYIIIAGGDTTNYKPGDNISLTEVDAKKTGKTWRNSQGQIEEQYLINGKLIWLRPGSNVKYNACSDKYCVNGIVGDDNILFGVPLKRVAGISILLLLSVFFIWKQPWSN